MKIPDFCDTSMFDTIVEHAKKGKRMDERQSTLETLKVREGSLIRGEWKSLSQIVKELLGTRQSSKKVISVSKQFHHSLNRLMSTLAHSTPYFIRCIKSNNQKIANHFDDGIILRQLRYTGMLETVRIRRAGYSVRIEYEVRERVRECVRLSSFDTLSRKRY